jgi:cell fate regulator YaaT (PSP1 superfamily)
MSAGPDRLFVSVKFSPAGRTYSFLLPELALDDQAGPEAGCIDGVPAPQVPPRSLRAHSSTPDTVVGNSPFVPGDQVIVRTEDGQAIATVTRAIPEIAERKRPAPESPARVLRRATTEDVITRLKHRQREQEAQRICLLKIRERNIAMKLARVEQLFDGSRLIFYYTAEGRVDFRELVRDLAAHFRTRIEMRQIGVRDEARMLGGYGPCGRPLCCTTWLNSFEPISIKMAKQQNLSLNPSKLSGMCGRLKCCLRYELPNGKGVKHGGCADEGGCGSCSNPTGPGGCGSCGSGGCGSCGSRS